VVITLDRAAMKRRRHQLPLLPVLVADHSGQTKAHPALRRISRSRQDEPGRPEQTGITEEQAIEFRADRKNQKIARLFERDTAKSRHWAVLAIEPANCVDRVQEKSEILAAGSQAGKLGRLHRNLEGRAAIADFVLPPSRTNDS